MFKIKKLEDFAVIKESKDTIVLKDLTIFMGDNSAGKSYLAMLIHSFISMKRGYQDENFLKAINSKFSNSQLITKLYSSILSIVENPNDKIILSLNENDKDELKEIIYFSLNDYLFKKYLVQTLFEKEDLKFIEIELSKFILPSIISIETIHSPNDSLGFMEINIMIDEKQKFGAQFAGFLFETNFIVNETLNNVLSNIIQQTIQQSLPINSTYLPASRTGYLQTYKILANQAIFKNYDIEKDNNKTHLSIIIRFFLAQLNSNTKYSDNKFSEFIEDFILNGKVDIYEDSNNIDFKLKSGERVDLNYLSSTISELIPLVVFLKRGIIKRGGLVVIEEPEAHLSFKNQRLIAKLIALLINNNIKVLITTHSDFLIYELNNLIIKNEIINNKNKVEEQEYKEVIEDEISINYKKVALYNFILENGKSSISKVPINKEGINNKYIFENTYALTKEKNKLLDLLDSING